MEQSDAGPLPFGGSGEHSDSLYLGLGDSRATTLNRTEGDTEALAPGHPLSPSCTLASLKGRAY